MVLAQKALKRLQEGNRRFVSDNSIYKNLSYQNRRPTLKMDQKPFAIVLGCSDSRVPAEIIFDQGLGDLFVIRVAGNIVAPSQFGSIEFAVEQFDTRLVVVMGHTKCGAILATLEELKHPTEAKSQNLRSIINRIRPSVEPLLATNPECQLDDLLQQAVHANINSSVDQLRHGSEILKKLIRENMLLIVGAEYSLENGIVSFFDESP